MKHLLTTLLLSCALSVLAVTPTGLGLSNLATVAAATPPASGSSFLLEEGYEGTGYENTWTAAGTGTVDPDEASTVIAGSQSLRVNLSAETGSAYAEVSAQSHLYTKFRLRVASTNGGNQTIATIRDGTTTLGTLVLIGVNRVLRVVNPGGGNGSSSATLPTNTNLFIWFEYVQGTGSNAIVRAGWDTSDSKPSLASSGAQTCYNGAGTSTATANRLYLGHSVSSTYECFFDAVQVSATAF
jgi:hypothetical protein